MLRVTLIKCDPYSWRFSAPRNSLDRRKKTRCYCSTLCMDIALSRCADLPKGYSQRSIPSLRTIQLLIFGKRHQMWNHIPFLPFPYLYLWQTGPASKAHVCNLTLSTLFAHLVEESIRFDSCFLVRTQGISVVSSNTCVCLDYSGVKVDIQLLWIKLGFLSLSVERKAKLTFDGKLPIGLR